jgi:hypothetical protein
MKHPILIGLLGAFSWPAVASAHMKLMYPPSRLIESGQGDPQKGNGPCGPTGGGVSKVRTKLKPGQTITVIWKETVHHSGHFRIAFDDDGEDAFKDPATAKDIVDPPAMPVLKDNLFPDHTDGQTMKADITLPNMTCKNCTLQVIQAMTSGNAVSMYYHCADIELANDDGTVTPPAPDAGTGTGGTGGNPGTGGGYGGTAGASPGTGGSGYPDPSTGGTGGAAVGTGGASGSSGSPGTGGAPSGTGGSPGGTGGSSPSGSSGGPAADAGAAENGSSIVKGSFTGCAFGGGRRPGALAIVLILAALAGRTARRRVRRT